MVDLVPSPKLDKGLFYLSSTRKMAKSVYCGIQKCRFFSLKIHIQLHKNRLYTTSISVTIFLR